MTSNREQIDYWNGDRGAQWVKDQEALDRALAPFGEPILAAAAPTPGERVIDVGCGCGATVLALAAAVGPQGSVLGVDVSAPMLARASERARDLPQVTFLREDAATYPFVPAAFDLVFSRFGVMFFVDPLAAFRNLARAVAPGGRLAFISWRSLAENYWLGTAFDAVKRVVPPTGPPLPPGAPGALAFADSARVQGFLEAAGFTDVVHAPFDHGMALGDGKGLESAVDHAMSVGPAGRLLAGADANARQAARIEVRAALMPYLDGEGVTVPAAAWLVTARRA